MSSPLTPCLSSERSSVVSVHYFLTKGSFGRKLLRGKVFEIDSSQYPDFVETYIST